MSGQRLIMAVTGAGGTRMARYVLTALTADERVAHVDLIVSAAGHQLVAHEFGGTEADDPVRQLLGEAPGAEKVTALPADDLAAAPTSGSYPVSAMLVLPCALGVLGRIAQGQATTLVERAADVCLKERRRLVLCVRETPFNLIHLRNMAQLTEAGGIVYPMIPTFYNTPQTIPQMYEEFAARLLAFLDLPQSDYYTWQDHDTPAHRDRNT